MKNQSLCIVWIRRTVLCLAAFCVLLEAITRLGFSRISHIESRIATEYRAALAVHREPGKTNFLLLGNSLPLEGVALPQLRSDLGARAECTRFVIEATEYLDWYYGIRRLLAEGSEPDLVILCIDATHLKSATIRGDYSAFYLFQTRDIPAVARDARYDLTKAAGLFLGRYSLFYAGRNGLRNFVLNHVDNAYAEMVRQLPKPEVKTPTPAPAYPEALVAKRLRSVREFCGAHHVRFVLLIPPGFGHNEDSVRRAAQKASTDVFIPVHENEFQEAQFRDGYHLNESGAKTFTDKLNIELQPYLERAGGR